MGVTGFFGSLRPLAEVLFAVPAVFLISSWDSVADNTGLLFYWLLSAVDLVLVEAALDTESEGVGDL
jgi:hypothetical protein